jgi:hypothetical protein
MRHAGFYPLRATLSDCTPAIRVSLLPELVPLKKDWSLHHRKYWCIVAREDL